MGIYSGENAVIKIDDLRYPRLLKEIGRDAPKQLYYRGSWSEDIFDNCLAVVGSRRMTSYGKQITQKLVSEIAGKGITIVSGFMYGIDATAHKSALDVGGRTIAVMPCGINIVHPEYQVKLYDEILENDGLIISEYEGDFLPTLWSYPRRNRIVAGLSKATLVIEAGEKSGSLITANLAKKFNKKVFAVPGPLTSVLSKGINQLIKEGAEVVTCAGDVAEFYNVKHPMSNTFQKCSTSDVEHLEQQIIQKLQEEPMEIDILSRLLKVPITDLGTTMSLMQIKGLVFIENGKYYVC
ncbi:DNA-processing protein DprA [Patescibacteria group bacterium]|nr:DNA-processing protein DprA [Patescibacteria group bacterium]